MAEQFYRVPLFPVEKEFPQTTVCVTGGTGYVASQLVKRLLCLGHTVHATVRDPAHAAHLLLEGQCDRGHLKIFQCNLMDASSFDVAMEGCTVVFHTACPFVVNVPRNEVCSKELGLLECIVKAGERLVRPAVQGTEAVLRAATQAGGVRRVVMTSSVAAVYGDAWDRGKGHVFTEEDWNESCSEATMPYCYAKTCAERRAWEMCSQQTGPSKWDLVTVCPALVLGPPLLPRGGGESVALMARICRGDFWPAYPCMGFGVVDVREVAAAHSLAAWVLHAAGRYILAGHEVWVHEIAAAAAQAFPGRIPLPLVPAPTPLVYLVSPAMGVPRDVVRRCFGKLPLHDAARVARDLGLQCGSVSLRCTVSDMVEAMSRHRLIRPVCEEQLQNTGPVRRWQLWLWESGKSWILDWPLQKVLLVYVVLSLALVAAMVVF